MFWSEVIDPTDKPGFTVMDKLFEAAGFPVAQETLEVRTQLIEFPLTGMNE